MNSLSREGTAHHIEPKVMAVLLTLAAQPQHVVAKEQLIATVWPDTFVGDDVLTRCVSILRRITEDSIHAPRFIQTVPKVGYRLVAAVEELPELVEPVAAGGVAGSLPGVGAEPRVRPGAVASRGWWSRGAASALILVVAMVALALTVWLRRSRSVSGETLRAFRTVQFTSLAGEQTQPAFSPDGRWVAFVLTPEDGTSRKIYVKQVGSESSSLLMAGPVDEEQFSPAWSPSGRQIAYLSRSPHGLGLYVVDVDGAVKAEGPARKLFIPQQPSHWDQGALSWSPDGRFLVFPDHIGSQPNSCIFELNVQTLFARPITTPPTGWEGDLNPAFSPDDRKLAFTRASETAVRDVYWISLEDGTLHALTHDRMDITSLAWSSDSRSVIFSSNRGGKYALWQMALSSTQPQRMPVGTEDAYQPAVGSRPDEMAYAQGSAVWSILRIGGAARPLGETQPRTTLISSTQQDSAPSASPDGRYFAIQTVRSGSQEIWIASMDGEALRQLTFMGGPLTGSPAWSHRGSQILFDSRPDGHSHIFVVGASGGQPRQLTFGNDNDIIPRWSRDDSVIYFRSNRGGRWQLWKIPSAGGPPQPVTTSDGIEPQESPDGRYLYYTRGDEDGLWRVPTAGGAESRVLRQPAAGFWGYWQITPWGLYYLDRSGDQASLRVLDPETRQNRLFARLAQSPPPYAGISVTDEGRTVLMTDETDAGRHITLVEAQP